MAINWPTWVTDETPIPANVLVPAKKLAWLFVAIEKLRLLHNGVFKWARSEALTSAEEACVAEEFAPGNWPLTYPTDTPTVGQAAAWIEEHWMPRSQELQAQRTQMRRAIGGVLLASGAVLLVRTLLA